MKEKLLDLIEKIKKINLLLVIFLAFGVKTLISPSNFASAAILLVFGLVYSVSRFLSIKEPEKAPNRLKTDVDKMQDDIKELKGALSRANLKSLGSKEKRYF